MNNNNGLVFFEPPPKFWMWYVFGKGPGNNHLLVCVTHFPVPLWRRVLTHIFLGSIWEKAK